MNGNIQHAYPLRLLLSIFIPVVLLAIALQAQTNKMDRPGFSLEYPADWTLSSDQSDFDPDRFFVIDTPGESSVTIELFNMQSSDNPDDLLFNAIYVLDGPLVDTYSRSQFSEWGRLNGEGTHLKGKVMSLFPGGARIFFAEKGGRGIMVTEIYYAEDLPQGVAAGFEIIGNSFRFK